MKWTKNWFTILLSLTLIVMGSAYFNGCSENSPLQPESQISEGPVTSLGTAGGALNKGLLKLGDGYPQFALMRLGLIGKLFEGGDLKVKNGSSFHVAEGALIPPITSLLRRLLKVVTVSMEVDLVEDLEIPQQGRVKALVYTFAPSGSQFDPPADAWFDFSDLNSPNAKVYYIAKDNNYIELEPAKVDLVNKRLLLKVHHFSRYAVAWAH